MTTGDIATWVIFAVIVIGFLFGLKRNGCSGGCHCDCCGTDNKLTSKVKDKQH